jgi:hypothetical protein
MAVQSWWGVDGEFKAMAWWRPGVSTPPQPLWACPPHPRTLTFQLLGFVLGPASLSCSLWAWSHRWLCRGPAAEWHLICAGASVTRSHHSLLSGSRG